MNRFQFKTLIQECIFETLMERDIQRVCMYCDLISPISGNNKSHGFCKEHAIQFAVEMLQKPLSQAREWINSQINKGVTFPKNTSGAKDTDSLPVRK